MIFAKSSIARGMATPLPLHGQREENGGRHHIDDRLLLGQDHDHQENAKNLTVNIEIWCFVSSFSCFPIVFYRPTFQVAFFDSIFYNGIYGHQQTNKGTVKHLKKNSRILANSLTRGGSEYDEFFNHDQNL